MTIVLSERAGAGLGTLAIPPLPQGWQATPGGLAWAVSHGHLPPTSAPVWGLVAGLAARGVLAYPEVVIERARGYAGKRWDLCLPTAGLVAECQGGGFNGGKHGRGAGLLDDYAKANLAVRLGWRQMFLVPRDLTANGGARASATWNGARR
jgi:hypothetical protein